jgi:excisionase family DNA binding protein
VSALALDLPDELVDALAERVAAKLADRQPGQAGGWLRGADRIAAYIDSPRSRVYALVSAGRIPVHRDGSALIARKAELDDWIQRGGGVRP